MACLCSSTTSSRFWQPLAETGGPPDHDIDHANTGSGTPMRRRGRARTDAADSRRLCPALTASPALSSLYRDVTEGVADGLGRSAFSDPRALRASRHRLRRPLLRRLRHRRERPGHRAPAWRPLFAARSTRGIALDPVRAGGHERAHQSRLAAGARLDLGPVRSRGRARPNTPTTFASTNCSPTSRPSSRGGT